ncbi:MAG: hypothetical protein QJR14_09675 [Bacillota bacterium]|nr:hypothetical protein [Bacillota bacterium]
MTWWLADAFLVALLTSAVVAWVELEDWLGAFLRLRRAALLR